MSNRPHVIKSTNIIPDSPLDNSEMGLNVMKVRQHPKMSASLCLMVMAWWYIWWKTKGKIAHAKRNSIPTVLIVGRWKAANA